MGILEEALTSDQPDTQTVNAPGVPLVDADSAPGMSQEDVSNVTALRDANPWKKVLQAELDKVAAAHPEMAQDRELAKLGAGRPRVRLPAAPGMEGKVNGYESHVDEKNGQIVDVPTYDRRGGVEKVLNGAGSVLSSPFRAAGAAGQYVARKMNEVAGNQTGPMDQNEKGISPAEKLKRERWNLELARQGTVPEQVGKTSEDLAVGSAFMAQGLGAAARAAGAETGGALTGAARSAADAQDATAPLATRATGAGEAYAAARDAIVPSTAAQALHAGMLAAQVPPMLMPAQYRDPTKPPATGFWENAKEFWTDPQNLGDIAGLIPIGLHGARVAAREIGDVRNLMDAFSRNAPPDHDMRVSGSDPNPGFPPGSPSFRVPDDMLPGGPSGPGPKLLTDSYGDFRRQEPVTSEENLFAQAPVAYASWQQVKDAMHSGDAARVLSRLGVFMDDLKKAGMTDEAARFADAISERWGEHVPRSSAAPDVGQAPAGPAWGKTVKPDFGQQAPNWPARPPAAQSDMPTKQGPPARLAIPTTADSVKNTVASFRAAAEALSRKKAIDAAREDQEQQVRAAALAKRPSEGPAQIIGGAPRATSRPLGPDGQPVGFTPLVAPSEGGAAEIAAEARRRSPLPEHYQPKLPQRHVPTILGPDGRPARDALPSRAPVELGPEAVNPPPTWDHGEVVHAPGAGALGVVEPGTWAMPDDEGGGAPPPAPPPAPPSPPSPPPLRPPGAAPAPAAPTAGPSTPAPRPPGAPPPPPSAPTGGAAPRPSDAPPPGGLTIRQLDAAYATARKLVKEGKLIEEPGKGIFRLPPRAPVTTSAPPPVRPPMAPKPPAETLSAKDEDDAYTRLGEAIEAIDARGSTQRHIDEALRIAKEEVDRGAIPHDDDAIQFDLKNAIARWAERNGVRPPPAERPAPPKAQLPMGPKPTTPAGPTPDAEAAVETKIPTSLAELKRLPKGAQFVLTRSLLGPPIRKRRTVEFTNSQGVYFSGDGIKPGETSFLSYPKASEFTYDDKGFTIMDGDRVAARYELASAATAPPTARPPMAPKPPEPAAEADVEGTAEKPFEKGKYKHAARFKAIVEVLRDALNRGELPKRPDELRKLAATATPGQDIGELTDEVHDAVEVILNEKFAANGKDTGPFSRLRHAERLEAHLGARARSLTMGAQQQFSTPLPISVVGAAACDLRPGDVVLEPTAGTGNLAVAAKAQEPEAQVLTNETDPRRRAALELLGFQPTEENYMGLKPDPKPTVVYANFPWGTFAGGKRGPQFGIEFTPGDLAESFFPKAFRDLPDGGRIVAINPTTTLDAKGAAFRAWIEKEHTLRAMIQAPEGSYDTRGTTVGSVLVVVDKGKATGMPATPIILTGENTPKDMHAFLQAVEQIPKRAATAGPIKAGAAPSVKLPFNQPEKPNAPEPEKPVIPGAPAAGSAHRPPAGNGRGGRGGSRGSRHAPGQPEVRGGGDTGAGEPERPGVGAGLVPEEPVGGESDDGEASEPVPRPSGEVLAAREQRRLKQLAETERSQLFVQSPLRSPIGGAPHPTPVVMTRNIAGQKPRDPFTYKPGPEFMRAALETKDVFGEPILSEDQIAGALVVLQANAHHGHGALLADGVGVGKSRELAAIALEWITTGQAKRILVLTKSENNVDNLIENMRLVASGRPDGAFPVQLHNVAKFKDSSERSGKKKPYTPLPFNADESGVFFVDASNLVAYRRAIGEMGIDALLGDEAHSFMNGESKRGDAWRDLHAKLLKQENPRVGYFTATPGTDVDDLQYLYGLGLWGTREGHFADWVRLVTGQMTDEEAAQAGVHGIAEPGAAPVAPVAGDSDADAGHHQRPKQKGRGKQEKNAYKRIVDAPMLEQIIRELAYSGRLVSRDLWRGGVEFNAHEGAFTPEQTKRYNEFTELAHDIQELGLQTAKLDKKNKGGFGPRGALQAAAKRLIFEFRLDETIKLAKQALAAGERPVISTISVSEMKEGEGFLKDAVNRINTMNVEIDDDGNIVNESKNWEAAAARDRLFDKVKAFGSLADPVERIRKAFGKENVCVVTGDETTLQRKIARKKFQNGEYKVALISGAGKTGLDFHDEAVEGKPTGTGRRHMFVSDYEWSASMFYQELGRVDRAGQVTNPKITIMHAGMAGEKKFISTIAARMRGLGATAKGDATATTSNDALQDFEIGGSMDQLAIEEMWRKDLDHEEQDWFSSNKFKDKPPGGTGARRPKGSIAGTDGTLKAFMLDLQFMPIPVANGIFAKFLRVRERIRSGMSDEMLQAMSGNTQRVEGKIVGRHEIARDLTLTEIKPPGRGKVYGILHGVITPQLNKIFRDALGTSNGGCNIAEDGTVAGTTGVTQQYDPGAPYMSSGRPNFATVNLPDGSSLSGMTLRASDTPKVKELFGVKVDVPEAADAVWDALEITRKIPVRGAGGATWRLVSYRPRDAKGVDGEFMARVDGATISDKSDLEGFAQYRPAGSAWVIKDTAALAKFLKRFPVDVNQAELDAKAKAKASQSGKANVALLTAMGVGAAIGFGVGGPAGAAIGAIAGPATYAAARSARETLSSVPEYIHDAMPEVYGRVAAAWSNMKELATHHPDLKKYELEEGVSVEQRVAIDEDRSNAIGIIQEKAIKAGIAAIEPSREDLDIATEMIAGLDERGSFIDAIVGEPDPVVPSGRSLSEIERDLQDLNADAKAYGTPAKVKALINLHRALDDEAFDWQVQAEHLRPESKKTGHSFRMSQERAREAEAARISGEKTGPPPSIAGGMVPAKEKPAWSSRCRSNAKVYERVNPWQALLVERIQAHKAVINHALAVDVSKKFGTPASEIARRLAAGEPAIMPGEALYSFDPKAPVMKDEQGAQFLTAWHQTVQNLINSLAGVYGGGAPGRARALANPQIVKAMNKIAGSMTHRGYFDMGGFTYAVLPAGLATGLMKARETMPKSLTWLSSLVTWGSRAIQAGMIVYAPSYWVGQATLHAHTHFAIPPTKWLKLTHEMAKGILKSLRAEFRESALGGYQVDPWYDEARQRGLQSSGMAEAPISGEVASHNYLPFGLKSGKQKAATIASLFNPFGEHGAANRILQGLGRVRETSYRMGHAKTLAAPETKAVLPWKVGTAAGTAIGAAVGGPLGALLGGYAGAIVSGIGSGGMGATPARAAIRANERGIWYTRRGLFARKIASPTMAFVKAAVEVGMNNTKRMASDPVTGTNAARGLVSTWAPIVAVAGAQLLWNAEHPDVAAAIPARYQDDLHVGAMVDTPHGQRLRVVMIPTNAGEFAEECKSGAAVGKYLYDLMTGQSTTGDLAPAREFFFGHLGPHIREPLEAAADENLATGADLTPDRYKGLSDEAQRELHEKEGGSHKTPREEYFQRNYSPGPLALIRRLARADEDKNLSDADRMRLKYGLRVYDMDPKAKELEEQRTEGPRLFEAAFDQWRTADKAGFSQTHAEIKRLGLEVDWLRFVKEKTKAMVRAPVMTPQKRAEMRAARIPGAPPK